MPAHRVRTEFTGIQGSPWLSTMYFGTVGSAADAVAAVGTFWTAVQGLMNNSVNWATLPEVEEIGVDGTLIGIESTTPETGSGGSATDVLPPMTQALVRWRTGAVFGNRELRGRTFIPGLTESAAVDGNLDPTDAATIQTAAAALIADIDSALVIWSREHAQQILVATASVWSQFASLRSRRD